MFGGQAFLIVVIWSQKIFLARITRITRIFWFGVRAERAEKEGKKIRWTQGSG